MPARAARDEGVARVALAVGAVLVALAMAAVALVVTDRLPRPGDGSAADGEASGMATRPRLALAAPAPPTPSALRPAFPPPATGAAASSSPGGALPTPAPARLAALTALLLSGGALGARPGAVVLDAASGAVLLDRAAAAPRVPASTSKLVTAAAALTALDPRSRLATTVVRPGPGRLVVVGGGDPTLDRADLAVLAARTAVALRAGPASAAYTLAVDDGAFTGPSASPAWPAGYLSAGVVARVSALSVDDGRARPGTSARVADPALAAGARLAAALRAAGVPVRGAVGRVDPAASPPGGTVAAPAEVARVESEPVATVVEDMLATSDNDAAEALARLAAGALVDDPSFAGWQTAAVQTLSDLGLDASGLSVLDGSGLARSSRIAPVSLAALLRAATTDPRLAPMLTGLPVAGWSGTLGERFRRGPATGGAGVVRAKTGTLSGVTALAGTALDADGRLLVFAVMADAVPLPRTLDARSAADRFAALLATCGCRA